MQSLAAQQRTLWSIDFAHPFVAALVQGGSIAIHWRRQALGDTAKAPSERDNTCSRAQPDGQLHDLHGRPQISPA